MKNFTVEEINLMCCFNTSSRKRLIDDMKSVTLNDMDGEIAELMYKTVRKLEAMTDAERGVCFSTYAVPVILGEIKKLFREGGTVKVSRSLKELGMRVQAAREHTMKLCGTEPTLSQLAEQLGESVENVAMAIQAAQPAMSLTPEGREDAEHQLDIPVESPEEALADRISLEEVLRALPEQDRQLIQLRFYGNRTQSETAKVLHTTQVQISRRERKILVLLRRRLLEE